MLFEENAQVPPAPPLTREQYEAACAAAGFTPLADARCCVIRENIDADSPTTALAVRRADAVEQEHPDSVCVGCDEWVPPELAMVANRGRSCPDCYDDLSE